jgi:hypothetical protein
VFVTLPTLPERLDITPSRHLPRRYSELAKPPQEEATIGFAKRALNDSRDLTVVAERTARAVARRRDDTPAERARLAAATFRTADVPARPVLLVPVGTASLVPGVLAYHPETDWLRFSMDRGTSWAVQLPVEAEGEFEASETGSLPLPEGAGAALLEALDKAWSKAARRYDEDTGFTISSRRLFLRGSAKKLTDAVRQLLED